MTNGAKAGDPASTWPIRRGFPLVIAPQINFVHASGARSSVINASAVIFNFHRMPAPLRHVTPAASYKPHRRLHPRLDPNNLATVSFQPNLNAHRLASMASETPVSSSAREEVEKRKASEVARQKRVALSGIPVVYGGGDDAGAEAIAPGTGSNIAAASDPAPTPTSPPRTASPRVAHASEALESSRAREEAAERTEPSEEAPRQNDGAAMSGEAAESSRAREEVAERREASEEVPGQRRPWVVLSNIPVVVGDKDERAARILLGTDLLLDLQEPPRATYLIIPKSLVPSPSWPPHHRWRRPLRPPALHREPERR